MMCLSACEETRQAEIDMLAGVYWKVGLVRTESLKL